MLKFDKPFPFFLNSDRGNFLLILGISVFCYSFLKIFKPFDENIAQESEIILYSVIIFVVMGFNILLLPRLANSYLDNCEWTLKKYVWFNTYNLIAISLAITISHYFTRTAADCGPFYAMIFEDLWKSLAIGIFPLVGITFALENSMLSQALKAGNEATSQLIAYRQKSPVENVGNLTQIDSETKESLDLDLNSFLFAQAENNYCEIFWTDSEGEVASKLMRLSLKNLEDQIVSDYVMRCHRSYMINLLRVDSVTGNANGYRLQMIGAGEGIPVSRTLGKDVLGRINEMSVSVA